MEIAVLLYDNFTALDCIGPYEVLSRIPAVDLKFVALKRGTVKSDTRMLGIEATHSIDEVPAPDILLVPGGPGDDAAAAEPRITAWLAKAHETTKWTTSVCTGSLILGAAGILKGLDATTHWAAYERLAATGATPVAERWVRRGKVITAAGVSAGIDMGIYLLGEEVSEDFAQMIQLAIEYDPQPPFEAGSPATAPAHIKGMVEAFFAAQA